MAAPGRERAGKPKVASSFLLPPDIKRELEVRSERDGISQAWIVEQALELWMGCISDEQALAAYVARLERSKRNLVNKQ